MSSFQAPLAFSGRPPGWKYKTARDDFAKTTTKGNSHSRGIDVRRLLAGTERGKGRSKQRRGERTKQREEAGRHETKEAREGSEGSDTAIIRDNNAEGL